MMRHHAEQGAQHTTELFQLPGGKENKFSENKPFIILLFALVYKSINYGDFEWLLVSSFQNHMNSNYIFINLIQ